MIRLVPINADGNAPGVLPAEAAEVLTSTAARYQALGFEPPWTGYLAFRGERCVGGCGFTAAPRENRVEITWVSFRADPSGAVATQMARTLIRIATAALPGLAVTARTRPEEDPSTRILQTLGFARTGELPEPGRDSSWEWSLHPDSSVRPSG